jgi:hypothetical protein
MAVEGGCSGIWQPSQETAKFPMAVQKAAIWHLATLTGDSKISHGCKEKYFGFC